MPFIRFDGEREEACRMPVRRLPVRIRGGPRASRSASAGWPWVGWSPGVSREVSDAEDKRGGRCDPRLRSVRGRRGHGGGAGAGREPRGAVRAPRRPANHAARRCGGGADAGALSRRHRDVPQVLGVHGPLRAQRDDPDAPPRAAHPAHRLVVPRRLHLGTARRHRSGGGADGGGGRAGDGRPGRPRLGRLRTRHPAGGGRAPRQPVHLPPDVGRARGALHRG